MILIKECGLGMVNDELKRLAKEGCVIIDVKYTSCQNNTYCLIIYDDLKSIEENNTEKPVMTTEESEELEKLKKKAKAFDLIKKKRVNISEDILSYDSYWDYYDKACYLDITKEYILTKDEWDFLKEMLYEEDK